MPECGATVQIRASVGEILILLQIEDGMHPPATTCFLDAFAARIAHLRYRSRTVRCAAPPICSSDSRLRRASSSQADVRGTDPRESDLASCRDRRVRVEADRGDRVPARSGVQPAHGFNHPVRVPSGIFTAERRPDDAARTQRHDHQEQQYFPNGVPVLVRNILRTPRSGHCTRGSAIDISLSLARVISKAVATAAVLNPDLIA